MRRYRVYWPMRQGGLTVGWAGLVEAEYLAARFGLLYE